jgi:hypothetical protein
MSRKINSLLVELTVADPQTSAFLDISKKIVETYRLIQKEKSEKVPKEPKTPKPKEPKVPKMQEPPKSRRSISMCYDCYEKLKSDLNEIII